MEPASDLKKWICTLCEEAGYVVASASIVMRRQQTLQESIRRIIVFVHEPAWNPGARDLHW
jgi:hypothetical protein